QQQNGKHLEGNIRATITAYYKIPKSYTKKRVQAIKEGLEYPQKKPDIDNCIKVILDALNGIAYEDDKQVVQVIAVKKWTEDIERVEFSLEEIKQGN
ncbi:MAG: RusA family crossover junction endodeoxyribonuclease, partial [Clostridiaceae bacterium]|nr:RusA family crossover junction endodeoxyribonuclease [Clostridiaceae bacterium]